MFEPAVKWTGSKRSQAKEIISLFPEEIDTYYEPFCGGCNVLRQLLVADKKVNHYVCSDINNDLINLWLEIKNNPLNVIAHYKSLWGNLNKDEDKTRKRSYFEEIRLRYNQEHSPLDFLFIMRTTTNGMPRYNKKGEFNNSFHITRNGIIPDKLEKIINVWSSLLQEKDVEFVCKDYVEIESSENDLLYLDPPYANTKGIYFGSLDNEVLFDWLRKQKGYYLLSFDGISGESNNVFNVPLDVYTEHKYLHSGNSSFKRVIGKSKDSIVYESLYLK